MIETQLLLMSMFLAFVAAGCAVHGEVDPTKPISLQGTGKGLLTTDNERQHTVRVGADQRIWLTALNGKSLFRMGATGIGVSLGILAMRELRYRH